MLEGWPERSLKDVVADVIDYRGKAPPKSESGIQLITARNVRFGLLDLSYKEYIPEEAYEAWMNRGIPRAEDLLFTTEAPLGNVCMFPRNGRFAVGQRIVTLRPNRRLIDPDFLCQYLLSDQGQMRISFRSTGSTARGIKSRELIKIRVPVPPLNEQRKIGDMLSTWDAGIEVAARLLSNKRLGLLALQQTLLGVGGHFRSDWKLAPLSELSTRIRRLNGGGNHPVMTISAKSGFMLQSDKYSRDMAGRSVENYIPLREGEFAYNKGNSLTYPQGCIFMLDRPGALVPFVYFCFALNPDLHHEFYAHIFEAGLLNRQLARLINSGVRNDGLLNINAEDFFGCHLPVLDRKEQEAIASALTAAKAEITLIEREIDALRRQKRGLMQKLLTGEWRVKVDSEKEAAA